MAIVIAEIEEENPVVSTKELTTLVDFVFEEDDDTTIAITDERIDLYDDLNVLSQSVSTSGTSGTTGTAGTTGTGGTSGTTGTAGTTGSTTDTKSTTNGNPKKDKAKNKGKKSAKSAPPQVQLSASDLAEINKKPVAGELKRLVEKANAIPQIPTYVKQALPLIVNEPYNINTPGKLAHFFGQIHTECSWNPRSEGVKYGAARAKEIFSSRIKDENEAKIITSKASNAVGGLPDIVYGARKEASKGESGRGGNRYGSSEGYDFRGHGLIQLTFKSPYYIKLDKLYPGEKFLAPGGTEKVNQPKWALISALLWWVNHIGAVYKNDVNEATIRAVSKSVNGKDPAHHLDVRIKWTNNYYNQLK